MGDLPHYFDIILFAMIAAFLVLRLRSVLGRRTGNERRREYLRGPATTGDKVVTLGQRPAPAVAATPIAPPAPADTVADGLAQIGAADPAFDATRFLDGARAAFEWVLGAFAASDKTKLRSLLSDDVYKPLPTRSTSARRPARRWKHGSTRSAISILLRRGSMGVWRG